MSGCLGVEGVLGYVCSFGVGVRIGKFVSGWGGGGAGQSPRDPGTTSCCLAPVALPLLNLAFEMTQSK